MNWKFVCFSASVVALVASIPTVNAEGSQGSTGNTAACATNTGTPGRLYRGFIGMVTSPVDFDEVEVSSNRARVIHEMRFGNYAPITIFNLSDAAGRDFDVTFTLADKTIVHKCTVQTAEFNADVDDPIDMQVGDCTMKQISGPRDLMVGKHQIFEAPDRLYYLTFAPLEVFMGGGTSEGELVLEGIAPGVATLAWTQENAKGQLAMSICPIVVRVAE